MKIREKIEKLVREYNLGTVVKNITRVTGGLAHRMYKLETDFGIYAAKELNPEVMKREDAYSKFVFSENVADIAKARGIPVACAIRLNGNIMAKVDDSFFMVFDWIEGRVLSANEITAKHSEKIGEIIARIHNIDFSSLNNENYPKEKLETFKWDYFLEKAKEKNMEYYELFLENIDLLKRLNDKSIEAMKYANKNMVISHRDMDRKNVMWVDDEPIVIDWEASGYVNPVIEVISTAYYWCGGELEDLDIRMFEAFVERYKKVSKLEIDKNSEILAYADFYSGLNWMIYNFKRSMRLEMDCDLEEVVLASGEVVKGIKDILYNMSVIDRIIEVMKRW